MTLYKEKKNDETEEVKRGEYLLGKERKKKEE